MSKKLYVKSTGPDDEIIKQGMKWLLQNQNNGAIVAVYQLSHVDNIFSKILTSDGIKRLKQDYKININGCTVTLVTNKNMTYSAKQQPVLAIFPNPKFLDKIDSIGDLGDVLVIPWMESDVKEWIKTRGAQELGNETESASNIVSNKVVEIALQTLTASVNHSTGIKHPSDKGATVSMFKILRDFGEDYDLDQVHSWLIQIGEWRADTAKEVVDIGRKIKEGRVVRGGNHWRPDIINTWRKEAGVTRDSAKETTENTVFISRTRVESSNIHSIGYDSENNILEIAFLSGGIYRYFNVSETNYDMLMEASSHGKYFAQYIKGRYRERKIQYL